jgi:hypothetical protein
MPVKKAPYFIPRLSGGRWNGLWTHFRAQSENLFDQKLAPAPFVDNDPSVPGSAAVYGDEFDSGEGDIPMIVDSGSPCIRGLAMVQVVP